MGKIADVIKDFFRRVFKKNQKKLDVESLRSLEGLYPFFKEDVFSRKREDKPNELTINGRITSRKLKKLIQSKPGVEILYFTNVDISRLDMSILDEAERLVLVRFENTKCRPEQITEVKTHSIAFENMDFRNPVTLAPNVTRVDISNCLNVSNIRNLDIVTRSIFLTLSDFSGISFVFPNLNCLSITYSIDMSSGKKGSNFMNMNRGKIDLSKIANGCPKLKVLYVSGIENDRLVSGTEIGAKFERLETFEVTRGSKLQELGSIGGMFPKVQTLVLKDTGLRSITGIHDFFPSLEVLNLVGSEGVNDLSPLLKYNGQLRLVQMKNALKDYLFQSEISKPTELTLSMLKQINELPIDIEKHEQLIIIIPDNFSRVSSGENDGKTSFVEIIGDIDRLKKCPKGRMVSFDIRRIPELSDEDKKVLTARFGFVFLYKIPIISRLSLAEKIEHRKFSLHSDEIISINACLEGMKKECQAEFSNEDSVLNKVKAVGRIISLHFQLIEVPTMDVEEEIKSASSKRYSVDVAKEIEKKQITPHTYIFLVNELLKSLGIENIMNQLISVQEQRGDDPNYTREKLELFGTADERMIPIILTNQDIASQYAKKATQEISLGIRREYGLVEPEIIIPISKTQMAILNGKKGVRVEERNIEKTISQEGVVIGRDEL